MVNKGFLNTFIAVLAATLFFYGVTTFGTIAFGNALTKEFGDQTYAGPFDISGEKGPGAVEMLKSDFTVFQSDFAVDLVFQDAVVELPVELVLFDAEQTVEQANSGEENPIVATVSVDGLRTILSRQFSPLQFSDESVEAIASGIEQELGTGIMPLAVHLTDYVDRSEFTETEIASSSIEIKELSSSFRKAIQALDGTELASFSSFSLLEQISESDIGPISDRELTILASALYATILETNFEVDERNIGSELSPFVEPGFEAAINQQLGLNFIFTNPNKTAFTLHLKFNGESIQASITGMPLLYQYEPYIGQSETYEPKTVRQFSAFVREGQVRVEDEGRNGMEVSVHRLISHEGSTLDDEVISTDFYAPMPKIELHSLKKESQQTSDSMNEGSGDVPQESEDLSESTTPETAPETTPDNQDENEGSKEVQYDKGGNMIK